MKPMLDSKICFVSERFRAHIHPIESPLIFRAGDTEHLAVVTRYYPSGIAAL
jgi:hypothetical protein